MPNVLDSLLYIPKVHVSSTIIQQVFLHRELVAGLFAISALVKMPSKEHLIHWIVEGISLVMAAKGCHYQRLNVFHKGDGCVLV